MTNNTITVMKKELARFFGDRRLVITTLLLPGIMIYVVYSFLGSAMMKSILPEIPITPILPEPQWVVTWQSLVSILILPLRQI